MVDDRTLEQVWDEHAGSGVKPRVYSKDTLWSVAALDCYGTDYYVITKAQVDALLSGGILRFPQNQGEYQCFLRLKKEG